MNPSRERIEACNFQPCQSTALVCTHKITLVLGSPRELSDGDLEWDQPGLEFICSTNFCQISLLCKHWMATNVCCLTSNGA